MSIVDFEKYQKAFRTGASIQNAAAGVSLLAPDAASAEALFQTNSTLTHCRTEIEQA